MKKIAIVDGPNLNLTGVRQPHIYGTTTMQEYVESLRSSYPAVQIEYFQSNVEGEIINYIQQVGFSFHGIVINAGGYSHTSVAIHDAITAITTPVIEVHISNIFAREEYRHHSLVSSACRGVVCGLGLDGYRYAVSALLDTV